MLIPLAMIAALALVSRRCRGTISSLQESVDHLNGLLSHYTANDAQEALDELEVEASEQAEPETPSEPEPAPLTEPKPFSFTDIGALEINPKNRFMVKGSLAPHCQWGICDESPTHYVSLQVLHDVVNGDWDHPDVHITIAVGLCLKHLGEVTPVEAAQRCWRELASMGLTSITRESVKLVVGQVGDAEWQAWLVHKAAHDCGGRC